MSQFMVDISLPKYFDEDFVSLIPRQRLHIDKLMSENVIKSYALSLDRMKLWATVSAETEEEVIQILHAFPLYEWIEYEIIPLMFYLQHMQIPAISLN